MISLGRGVVNTWCVESVWGECGRRFGALDGDVEADVVVIGAGVAGLWCAFDLVRAGERVCVLEADKVAGGVTAGSSAILTYAQDVIYAPLIKKHGVEVAKKYLADTRDAIAQIVRVIRDERWDCGLELIDFVLFARGKKCARALERERRAYAQLDFKTPIDDARNASAGGAGGLPYKVRYALMAPRAYQIDPVKLCECLASYIVAHGGKIYEGARVETPPEDNVLRVAGHAVTANAFVVATHFPIFNMKGLFWAKMHQEQNYSVAFTPSERFDGFCRGIAYESIDKTGYEYRRVGDKILCDGVSVRTGGRPRRGKYAKLAGHILKYFDAGEMMTAKGGHIERNEAKRWSEDISTENLWCAQDCMTLDKLPYAGLYSVGADNIYVTTGFNKWGMTNSYICAGVVCAMICGDVANAAPSVVNPYTPQRVALFLNFRETMAHLGHVVASLLAWGGPRCPHIGCKLKWNRDEQTWDCPCHGSRFDKRGRVINNPSTKDM